MDMQAIEKKIYELMDENHIMGEVVDYKEETKMIAVEIIWGDWKHSHLRMDWAVKDAFPNFRTVRSRVTEENGSDCYSAIRYYYFY
jgi:hypothetical protein